MTTPKRDILEQGQLPFTIESRIIRELGERLVKQPEIAILELIKNAYDADSRTCTVVHRYPHEVMVRDDGSGMTMDEFKAGWMRIGTSSKEEQNYSRDFHRVITGEKGIGRFAVRSLGRKLHLESVALDPSRKYHTHLTADFNWPEFDRTEDLGKVKVPYKLRRATDDESTGTLLIMSELRPSAQKVDFRALRTASLTVATPYHSLLREPSAAQVSGQGSNVGSDPGFALSLGESLGEDPVDVAEEVLRNYVLRSVVELKGDSIKLRVYGKGADEALLSIVDKRKNLAGPIYADIRFYPQRAGTFRGLKVDGRNAKTWVKANSGVAVFDRMFRVYPYGAPGDDWLKIAAEGVRNVRDPKSSIALKHFPMDDTTHASTELNYMLRLPHNEQLVGVVQVEGQRSKQRRSADGLVPAADREGFVENEAYAQLQDAVRGAVEAIAFIDRQKQIEEKKREEKEKLGLLRQETRRAIRELESNKQIPRSVRLSLVNALLTTQRQAEEQAEISRERETALEVMSLLGVVAGFMTHEFDTAIDELHRAHKDLDQLAKREPIMAEHSAALLAHINTLRDFVNYSQAYIRGAPLTPNKPFPVKPRITQAVRIFGKYAADRDIKLSVDVAANVEAPLVPVSLYNGIVLNLYTNALKAINVKPGNGRREIAFRAWNERDHHFLEVSDTGIGIPNVLQSRIFDPLFTTTSSNRGPLGSGMGLGLTLVKRGAEAFGGAVEVVKAPPGFSTCFRVKIPISG